MRRGIPLQTLDALFDGMRMALSGDEAMKKSDSRLETSLMLSIIREGSSLQSRWQ